MHNDILKIVISLNDKLEIAAWISRCKLRKIYILETCDRHDSPLSPRSKVLIITVCYLLSETLGWTE